MANVDLNSRWTVESGVRMAGLRTFTGSFRCSSLQSLPASSVLALLYCHRLRYGDRTAGEGRHGGRTHARCDAASGASTRKESAGQDRARDSTRRREGHDDPGGASRVAQLATGRSRSRCPGERDPCCIGVERRAARAAAPRRRRCRGATLLGLGGRCGLSDQGGLAATRVRRGGGGGGAAALACACSRACGGCGHGLGVGCPGVRCSGRMLLRRDTVGSYRLRGGLCCWGRRSALGSAAAAGVPGSPRHTVISCFPWPGSSPADRALSRV